MGRNMSSSTTVCATTLGVCVASTNPESLLPGAVSSVEFSGYDDSRESESSSKECSLTGGESIDGIDDARGKLAARGGIGWKFYNGQRTVLVSQVGLDTTKPERIQEWIPVHPRSVVALRRLCLLGVSVVKYQ